jgi:hypothetical protein
MFREVEKALPALIEAWAKATGQPLPPNGTYRYSFASFYDWLKRAHPSYTVFRSGLDPRYPIESSFEHIVRAAPPK